MFVSLGRVGPSSTVLHYFGNGRIASEMDQREDGSGAVIWQLQISIDVTWLCFFHSAGLEGIIAQRWSGQGDRPIGARPVSVESLGSPRDQWNGMGMILPESQAFCRRGCRRRQA